MTIETARDLYPATQGDVRRILAELAALRAELAAATAQDTDEPKHLTPQEVAARLRCSRKHVYQLIGDGRIQAMRVGDAARGRWLVPASEMERLEGEAGSTSA